jgi:hypothetical protein
MSKLKKVVSPWLQNATQRGIIAEDRKKFKRLQRRREKQQVNKMIKNFNSSSSSSSI